jgi:hypothetical protein
MFRRHAAHVHSFGFSSACLVLASLLTGSPLHAQQPDRFTRAGAGLTGVYRSSSTLGDVDGDGTLDLVITGRDQNRDPTTTLYENLSS